MEQVMQAIFERVQTPGYKLTLTLTSNEARVLSLLAGRNKTTADTVLGAGTDANTLADLLGEIYNVIPMVHHA